MLGAGIAGLTAAIALRRAGYAVTVHDRAPTLDPAGAALSLWPNAMQALSLIGAADRIGTEAAPIASISSARRDGRPIFGPLRIDAVIAGGEAYLPTRTFLQNCLLDALGDVPIQLGQELDTIEDIDTRPVVRLADGTRIVADLVIDATGIWSATATRLIGNPPTYRGYGGVIALSDALPPLPPGCSSEFWGEGERFGLFDAGGGRRYWFYMRNQPANATIGLSDVRARTSGWPAVVTDSVAGTAAAALIPFAIHARGLPRRLGAGRVICVGDAVHAMEPNLGQGACQAIEDAAALAMLAPRCEPDALLPAFETARLARIRRFMRRSRSGGYGAHGGALTRTATRLVFGMIPPAVQRRMMAGMLTLPDYAP